MKIIDLLNKIAKGEEVPTRIKFLDYEWVLITNEKYKTLDYKSEDYLGGYLFDNHSYIANLLISHLNEEVEVIEEEKEIEFEDIKELGNNFTFENTNSELEVRDFEKSIISKKINSLIKNQKKIIDVINDMRDKE